MNNTTNIKKVHTKFGRSYWAKLEPNTNTWIVATPAEAQRLLASRNN